MQTPPLCVHVHTIGHTISESKLHLYIVIQMRHKEIEIDALSIFKTPRCVE